MVAAGLKDLKLSAPDDVVVGGGSVVVARSRGGKQAVCAARSLKLNWLRRRLPPTGGSDGALTPLVLGGTGML